MCNKDCFNCPYEDCKNDEDIKDISEDLDLEIKLERKRLKATTRVQRYASTRKGYENRKKHKLNYEKNHPDKTALWRFKSRIRREKGYDPSEEECRMFLIRRGYISCE